MHMPRKSLFGEFSVLGMFLLVAIAGMAYGAYALGTVLVRSQTSGSGLVVAEQKTAPTAEEYHVAARKVLKRFFVEAESRDASVLVADSAFMNDVSSSLESLLQLSVPREEMQAHLEAAMLLGKWKNAQQGSGDPTALSGAVQTFAEAHPWINERAE